MKYIKKIIICSILTIICTTSVVFATNKSEVENYIKEKNINLNTISPSEIITMYQDFTKEHSNSEIVEIIDEYSDELQKRGISNEMISTGKAILNSTDTETLNEVLEDVNIEEIKQKIDNGISADEILNDITDNMSTTQKITTASKLVFSNKIIKEISILCLLYLIYKIIIRGFIYKKAGEHYFATFIPFYRDIILFKICGYSPWWLLLLLIPIIGWFIYGILKIVMNFELSAAFGKGIGFGLGLWFLKPIFETIIAFSKKLKFVEIDE